MKTLLKLYEDGKAQEIICKTKSEAVKKGKKHVAGFTMINKVKHKVSYSTSKVK